MLNHFLYSPYTYATPASSKLDDSDEKASKQPSDLKMNGSTTSQSSSANKDSQLIPQSPTGGKYPGTLQRVSNNK